MDTGCGEHKTNATTTTTMTLSSEILPLDLEVPDPPKLLSISPQLTSVNNTKIVNNEKPKEVTVQSLDEKQTEIELAQSSISQTIIEIPEEAKKFKFGCQIMIIGLSSKPELNKKLGFIVGDYKKYSQRIPVRLITNTDPLTTYLLKLKNLQFVSPPIPGYNVEAYKSSESDSSDQDNDNDNDSDIESQSDSESTSSSESSLSHTLSMKTLNVSQQQNGDEDNEDDDIKANKLKKANESRTKYLQIMQEFNKSEPMDLTPSVTSTKSLPIDCGLRWEPKPITEKIENMKIEKIGTISTIINDLEVVIESDHSSDTVITFDSVLCLADYTPIGRVDDIFGAVKKPHYFVRLTVDKAVALKDKISQNMDVFAVQSLTKYAVPPQTDERYSSESECDSSSDSNEDYGPNRINKQQQKVSKHKYPKRRKRTMSVDRFNGSNQRRQRGAMQYNHHQKRQRYSNPYVNVMNSATYYPPFGALPTAIPPPNTQSAAMMQQTASMFRPQVNIIPSVPPMNYYSNPMMYHGQRPHQSQQRNSKNDEEKEQKSKKNKISTNPFSFGK